MKAVIEDEHGIKKYARRCKGCGQLFYKYDGPARVIWICDRCWKNRNKPGQCLLG